MCGGGGAPSAPSVDPAGERRKAEADATIKANEEILTAARRKRRQKGLLATALEGFGDVITGPAPTALSSAGNIFESGADGGDGGGGDDSGGGDL